MRVLGVDIFDMSIELANNSLVWPPEVCKPDKPISIMEPLLEHRGLESSNFHDCPACGFSDRLAQLGPQANCFVRLMPSIPWPQFAE